METIEIKVVHDGWHGYYAHIEGACLCPECVNKVCGSGKLIQEAIDDLLEKLYEKYLEPEQPESDLKYKWS